MAKGVTIKSYPKGLSLYINADFTFEEILDELESTFNKSRSFFGKSALSLAIEGVLLTPEQEAALIETIERSSDLTISAIVGQDGQIAAYFDTIGSGLIPAAISDDTAYVGPYAAVYYGDVMKGNVIESDDSYLIYGNIEAGAKVRAQGDVIVLGALHGEVSAGLDGQPGHIVAALSMECDKLCIGEHRLQKKSSRKLFGSNTKKIPQVAYEKHGSVELVPLTVEEISKIAGRQ